MSITATWSESVFKPIGDAKGAIPGKTYRVYSDEELLDLTQSFRWLKSAEHSFEFWNNDENAAFDQL